VRFIPTPDRADRVSSRAATWLLAQPIAAADASSRYSRPVICRLSLTRRLGIETAGAMGLLHHSRNLTPEALLPTRGMTSESASTRAAVRAVTRNE
jgi:hypothetical protein